MDLKRQGKTSDSRDPYFPAPVSCFCQAVTAAPRQIRKRQEETAKETETEETEETERRQGR